MDDTRRMLLSVISGILVMLIGTALLCEIFGTPHPLVAPRKPDPVEPKPKRPWRWRDY